MFANRKKIKSVVLIVMTTMHPSASADITLRIILWQTLNFRNHEKRKMGTLEDARMVPQALTLISKELISFMTIWVQIRQ